jgi:hypothetical protein
VLGSVAVLTLTFLACLRAARYLLLVTKLAAVTLTGLIWTRYSTQINPINYNLMTVNAFMAVTGIYQLSRKIRCALECSADLLGKGGCCSAHVYYLSLYVLRYEAASCVQIPRKRPLQ